MKLSRKLLTLYQLLAGLCDASTGVLLLIAPAWTLRLMDIARPPEPLVFASYIGVFVFAVGLSYLWSLAFWPLSARTAQLWQAQWTVTALVRSLVAVFVSVQVMTGALEPRWISVAGTDAVFALIQWMGLGKQWLSMDMSASDLRRESNRERG